MLFGDVIAIALSIIGFLLSLQGLWLVSSALWPTRVAAAGRRAERSIVACFFAGVGLAIVLAVLIRVTVRGGAAGQVFSGVLGLVFLIYAGVGMAGFVNLIGRRLASPADLERPWKATIRGGVALELACLFPILGWLGVLPIALIIGAGATTLSFFGGKPTAPPPVLDPVRETNGRSTSAADREPEFAGATR